jgi:hypothetical protein
MKFEQLIQQLKSNPEGVTFNDVMTVIKANYDYQATAFRNGLLKTSVVNDAGSNEGSCKIFAFAQLNGLSKEQTLACFGDYYRTDVLQFPNNTDHQNIRNFINDGWAGIEFFGTPLTQKVNND